jgi:hypothetical protein|tara:strand:+ start:239 stop:373 length:135 start_codon:yes stop_codon:yes gene_type:complete
LDNYLALLTKPLDDPDLDTGVPQEMVQDLMSVLPEGEEEESKKS